jgi:hypothetical protein
MGRSVSDLVGTVRTLIQESHGYSSQLVGVADQLGDVSDYVAKASHQQSEAASASAASIEQMTVSIQMVSDNTQGVEEQARHATAEATHSSQLAAQAADEIRQIADSITSTAKVIEQLNQRSGEIGNIVQVIRDIADQTNLLALNAAIEAARAGEMGRGFAVVADEVRKLAERTSVATAEISSRISSVQTDTKPLSACSRPIPYRNRGEQHAAGGQLATADSRSVTALGGQDWRCGRCHQGTKPGQPGCGTQCGTDCANERQHQPLGAGIQPAGPAAEGPVRRLERQPEPLPGDAPAAPPKAAITGGFFI